MPRAQASNPDGKSRGLIFNIQKFSLHDGTGIRTLVFLKGCPLKCSWCANPEGQSYALDLAYNANKCIGTSECGRCVQACARRAVRECDDGKIEIDRALCDNCGECVEACPSRALEAFGTYVDVEDVIRAVEEDSSFYVRSGGGLTLSGGEPVSQAAFVIRLLQTARGRGIDTALETSGYCNWKDLEGVCAHVNQIFFDIKSMDPVKHRRNVGVENGPILDNFRRLCEAFPDLAVTVRTPVIPDFNDSPEDIRAIADFIDSVAGACPYELLPYHRFGEPKYHQLGKAYPLCDLVPPPDEHMRILRAAIQSHKASLQKHDANRQPPRI
jgi:pyruvate formate lyase activating enzyme